jgi:ribosomal protein S7
MDDLLLPHNIDMIHSKKNIAEELFRTLMDIAEKTKDNVKARVDQAMLCDSPKLDMRPPRAGKSWKKPRADFILMRPQRREVLEWFQILMFPDGYATNLT